eukprot:gene17592-20038_t
MEPSSAKRKIDELVDPLVDSEFAVRDARRTYSQLLLNTFNTCDIAKLKKIFKRYCTPDLYSICSYEGVNNPYAPQLTEVRTIENHIDLWVALFKSAPDFLFRGEFAEAYIDPETNCCVVRSKFTFSATRILDVIVAKRVNAEVLLEKKQHLESDEFITSERLLMNQIGSQCGEPVGEQNETSTFAASEPTGTETMGEPTEGRPRADSVASTITANSEGPEQTDIIKENQLFDRENAQLLEGDMYVYAEDRPLAESMVINCEGTFTVYLNTENKIDKYVFLYSAMETLQGRR